MTLNDYLRLCLALIIWLGGCLMVAFAQDNTQDLPLAEPAIRLIATYDQGAVLLRWAPTNPEAWRDGIRYGYRVERQPLRIDQAPHPERFESLAQPLIQVWSIEDFAAERMRQPDNTYLLAAAECIHGELNTAPANQGLAEMLPLADALNHKFASNLLAADLNFTAAEASGLGLRDEAVEEGQQYLYRVYIAYDRPDAGNQSAYERVACQADAYPPFIPEISGITEAEGRVNLHWQRATHDAHFSAYRVETSFDGETFEPVNAIPYVHALGEDERLQTDHITYALNTPNGEERYYRLRGITPFGQWSPPSAVVKATARDRTPPSSPEAVRSQTEYDRVRISWQQPTGDSDLVGFRVQRTLEYRGEFTPLHTGLLPVGTTEFVDERPNLVGVGYYQVVAVDLVGNERASVVVSGFVEDHQPPASPVGLQGEIDEESVVRLSWAANAEPDVAGYHVYLANAPTDLFVKVSTQPLSTARFKDTISLKTLTETVCYRVTAIDRRGNYSPFSKTLTLERPDQVPPRAPVFQQARQLGGQVQLTWQTSTSRDVVKQLLYRKTSHSDWLLLRELTPRQAQFTDEEVTEGCSYQYQLMAEDERGLRSAPAFPVSCELAPPAVPTLTSLEATRSEQGIELSWELPGEKVSRLIIYRSTAEGSLQTLTFVEREATFFMDISVRTDQAYTYAIRCVTADGRKGPLSEPLEVKVDKL